MASSIQETRKQRADMPSIAAVVVTFNRKAWLLQCIDSLLAQTVPLHQIYIIDNASSDGTESALRETFDLQQGTIRYIRLDSNTGGAGGFNAGIRAAFDDGNNWVWVMDDDVEAYPDALEKLHRFMEKSECIHGRRSNPDGTPYIWGELFNPKNITTSPISDPLFAVHREMQEVTTGCFEGMLISRNVVAKIGFPDPRFFITWDDTFYGYLASEVTRVLYVNVFVLKRKRFVDVGSFGALGSRQLLSPLALYHFHRNRFLIADNIGAFSAAFWCTTLKITLRGASRELFLIRSWRRASAIIRGVLAGIRIAVIGHGAANPA